MTELTSEQRLLAAIAYGEASTKNDPQEIGAIAWAVANRARMWGQITVSAMIKKDPNYTYAVSDGNQRYGRLMAATDEVIAADSGMSVAASAASSALAGDGVDLASGGIFWDGLDFKTNAKHPKRQLGFAYGDPAHDIFRVPEYRRELVIYWKVINKKTGAVVDGKERGRFDHVYESTAAYGSTIIWRYSPQYLKASGAKAYR